MAIQRAPWDLLRAKDPEMARLHGELDDLAFSDGRLPRKVKLLMAMAIDAVLGADLGVNVMPGGRAKRGQRMKRSLKRYGSRPSSGAPGDRPPLFEGWSPLSQGRSTQCLHEGLA